MQRIKNTTQHNTILSNKKPLIMSLWLSIIPWTCMRRRYTVGFTIRPLYPRYHIDKKQGGDKNWLW